MSTNITRRNALKTIGTTSAVVATATPPAIANSKVDPHQGWMDRIEECQKRRSELYNSNCDDDDPELEALYAETDELEIKIVETTPRTLAGIDAKLRFILDDPPFVGDRFIIPAIEDVRLAIASLGGAL